MWDLCLPADARTRAGAWGSDTAHFPVPPHPAAEPPELLPPPAAAEPPRAGPALQPARPARDAAAVNARSTLQGPPWPQPLSTPGAHREKRRSPPSEHGTGEVGPRREGGGWRDGPRRGRMDPGAPRMALGAPRQLGFPGSCDAALAAVRALAQPSGTTGR